MATKKPKEPHTVISNNQFYIEPVIHDEQSIAAIVAIARALEANAKALARLSSSLQGVPAVGLSVGV